MKPTDIVILGALRTPFTRARKGGLRHMMPETLLASVISSVLTRSSVDASLINEVHVGTVLQALGGQKTSAMAVYHSGLPYTTTVSTVNRQCASSAQAATNIANSLRNGDIEFGLACGVESMTLDYFADRGIPQRFEASFKAGEAGDVLIPMGVTSENVAEKYGISRQDQDQFALHSHLRAAAASDAGFFRKEIAPVQAKDDEGKLVTVEADDGIRFGATAEGLEKLKPVFSDTGSTTAGNSSQISDGASAVLLTTRAAATKHGYKPLARFVSSFTVGVPAALMGVGPVFAVAGLLKKNNLDVKDISLFELNEAFASQSLHCQRELGIEDEKLNVHGGAIALGHPLGATGGRLITTVVNSLTQGSGQFGVLSMCTSTGQGYAALIEKE